MTFVILDPGHRKTGTIQVKKLIIEVRGNEYANRNENRNVPWTPGEIAEDAAACREAGAAIYHFHARNDDGSPSHESSRYMETAAKMRSASDILLHPTLGFVVNPSSAEGRLQHILDLAGSKDAFPDFAPLDMGSINVDYFDAHKNTFTSSDKVYQNSNETLIHFANRFKELGIKPYLVAWTIGFSRLIDDFLNMGLVDEPAIVAFNLTDGYLHAGHPPTIRGLMAHLDFLPHRRKTEWSVYSEGANLFRLASTIIAEGGHISIGIGDYPYCELGSPDNATLVREIVNIARLQGREVATPSEAKEMLGMG